MSSPPASHGGERGEGERPLAHRRAYQVFARAGCSGGRRRTRASTATQPSGEPDHRVQVELGDLGMSVGEP